MEFIGPAAIVLFGNLFSGKYGSKRWEFVTACYGWLTVLSIVAYMIGLFAVIFTDLGVSKETFNSYMVPIIGFAMMQALSRDYEKILRPFFDRWLDGE